MNLQKELEDNKSAILKKWFDRTIETYPKETARFLKNKKNQFANPVGYIISQELEPILDGLFRGVEIVSLVPLLENIIRIRAVQDFPPSRAIAFIFFLKKVIREELEQEIQERKMEEEILALDSRIDEMGLISFDIFMHLREKIYALKASELNNRTIRLLKRAKLIVEDRPEEATTTS
jgi:predicted Ser/Thr protein kinase